MSTATSTAAVQPNFKITVPKKEHTGQFFVFFAADLIAGDTKSNNPAWLPGGMLRPNAITLKYRHGYIRKCEITEMRQAMISETVSNIAPAERRHMAAEYIQHVGDDSVRIGRTKDGAHDGLLRIPFFPDMEIERITGARDGLVKMPVNTAEEAVAAQYFLFPTWDSVLDGTVELPRKIAALRTYFRDRLKSAKDKFQVDVANAAIKSCDDFASWGMVETTSANQKLRQAVANGWAWTYGSDAEMAFEQLNLQRQDSLVQDQGNQMNTLTDAVTKLVEAQLPKVLAEQQPITEDPDFAEFKKWKADQAREANLKPTTPSPVYEITTVRGRPAEIINPQLFGKVRVRYIDDKTEETVERDMIGTDAPPPDPKGGDSEE